MLPQVNKNNSITDQLLAARKIYRRKVQIDKSIARRKASIARKIPVNEDTPPRIAFTFCVVAIAAKIAALDIEDVKNSNSASFQSRINSFKETFSISKPEFQKIDFLYMEANNDKIPAEHYARQIRNLFPDNRLLFEELIENMVIFADSDTSINTAKVNLLRKITLAFKLNENFLKATLRKHLMKVSNNPFELLGVDKKVSSIELKRIYRDVVKECHPDKFSGKDIAPELIEIARDQFNHYTIAYNAIKDKRGFK